MYTLYLHDSYNIQRRRFTSIEAAKDFFNKLKDKSKVPARFLVTVESSKLDDAIVLQRPSKSRQLKINPTV